jgi:hypothetical protein
VSIRKPNYNPPFNFTRPSDAVLDIKSSAKRRALPARAQWYTQASRLAGVEPCEPAHKDKDNPSNVARHEG